MPPIAVQSSAALSSFSASIPYPISRLATPTSLGLVTYCFNIAAKHADAVAGVPNFKDPAVFIQQAAAFGAAAVQIPFGVCDGPAVRRLRDLSEQLGIALESTISLPRDDSDLDRFEAELRNLQDLGISICRTVLLPGRRYEQFKSILDYAAAMRRATKALSDAEKIARRHEVRLALENHKDHTLEERLALLEQFSSEYIGACLDIGNNIALLENPLEVARAFAPWTLTVHFKDQGVREYDQGFLLADVPVGQGAIDLQSIVGVIRERKPNVRFHLELITRDPLQIPYLRDDYWSTLDAIRASKVGGTLALLKSRSSQEPFPEVSILSAKEQIQAEYRNIDESLRFAATHLGFSK